MLPAVFDVQSAELTGGFPPILGSGARVLVLGSLPSVKSLEKNQYYGHPRNAFWPIMGELFGAGRELAYAERRKIMVDNGVAIWDVLASSNRPGSMDAAIDEKSATANDFNALLRDHPGIRLICFNGQAAARLFRRLVAPTLENGSTTLDYQTMPSTSPAYAAMRFEEKLARWRLVREVASNS